MTWFRSIFCLAAVAAVSCESSRTASTRTQAPAAPASAASSAVAPDDSVPGIAQREVLRRMERIRQMDEAALKASEAMAEDDLEGAVNGYRRAVEGL